MCSHLKCTRCCSQRAHQWRRGRRFQAGGAGAGRQQQQWRRRGAGPRRQHPPPRQHRVRLLHAARYQEENTLPGETVRRRHQCQPTASMRRCWRCCTTDLEQRVKRNGPIRCLVTRLAEGLFVGVSGCADMVHRWQAADGGGYRRRGRGRSRIRFLVRRGGRRGTAAGRLRRSRR